MIDSDIERLNSFPVNRKAEIMLRTLELTPESTCLYTVQLALWGIEKAGLHVENSVAETVRAMTTWTVARLVNFLMLSGESEVYSPAGWEGAQTPEQLASVILESIEGKMMIHFPWCFSAE
jgi:hypothetical protein